MTATNGDATKGVRLRNVTYHLNVDDDSVRRRRPAERVPRLIKSFDEQKGTRRSDPHPDVPVDVPGYGRARRTRRSLRSIRPDLERKTSHVAPTRR